MVGEAEVIDDRNVIARSFLLSEQTPPGFERVKNVLYMAGEPPEPRQRRLSSSSAKRSQAEK